MSVIVKGMEMPRCCEECLAESVEENYYGDVMSTECPFIYKGYTEEVRKTGRLEECFLIEVPTPHGRLVDIEQLKEKIISVVCHPGENHGCHDCYRMENCKILKVFEEAPTIIEAEGT